VYRIDLLADVRKQVSAITREWHAHDMKAHRAAGALLGLAEQVKALAGKGAALSAAMCTWLRDMDWIRYQQAQLFFALRTLCDWRAERHFEEEGHRRPGAVKGGMGSAEDRRKRGKTVDAHPRYAAACALWHRLRAQERRPYEAAAIVRRKLLPAFTVRSIVRHMSKLPTPPR
jgi:hypothetical protein